MGVGRHMESVRKQGGEGKLELEEKQEGDKWMYSELWKIYTKIMEEMAIDPCYHPSRCKDILL